MCFNGLQAASDRLVSNVQDEVSYTKSRMLVEQWWLPRLFISSHVCNCGCGTAVADPKDLLLPGSYRWLLSQMPHPALVHLCLQAP